MNEGTALVQWDNIKFAIASCKDILTLSKFNYSLEAVQKWAKQSKQSLETQNEIAEYRIRLNRKQGEWIQTNIPEEGARGLIQDHLQATKNSRLSLADAGIDKNDSPKFRALAEIPDEKFEQFISETKAKCEELTSKAALGIAQKIKREAEPKNTELPPGQFNVICADPPWKYDNSIESWGPASLHYQSLSIEQIAYYLSPQGIRVQDKFASDSVLFLWVTNPFVRDAFEVVDAWGFEYKTNIVWVKTELQRPGSGFYVRGRHELLFICTKGSFVPDQTGKEPVGSVIEAPVQEHSQKPDIVYEIIERIYPEGKYLELFARKERRGWTSWGNEKETTIT